ncbi:MAG: hypothetical protein OEM67_03000 [Thermoleophilia bacterium]|nr:hypothetical protein [Thermoleophilia bacterium]
MELHRYVGVPDPGHARVRINLWLARGQAPLEWSASGVATCDLSFIPA